MIDAAELRESFRDGRVLWTLHAGLEAADEAIGEDDAEAAVAEGGEIIEDYPNDPRGASCLVLACFPDGAGCSTWSWGTRVSRSGS